MCLIIISIFFSGSLVWCISKTNHKLQKAPGSLRPIPAPSKIWSQVSMDLIGPLPKISRGNQSTWASPVLPAFFLVLISWNGASLTQGLQRLATCSAMHGGHTYGATKVLGECEDCSAQIRDWSEEWGWSTNFCQHFFVHEDIQYSLVKPDSCFSCKILALQDYNNKAPDDELATVPC